MSHGERIHKFLSRAGLGSRREIERWVREGRVRVNGEVATLGQPVTPSDQIQVDGRRIAMRVAAEVPCQVLIYRKPSGQIVTRSDPQGRETVFANLPRPGRGRWVAVGRLDVATSGVLAFTTDGELAQRLMRPEYRIPRQYSVRVFGQVTEAQLKALRSGVELDDGMARFDALEIGGATGDNQWFHVTVHEGRNRLVRRLWESQGLQVSRLIRTRFGPLVADKSIRAGGSRLATGEEVQALRELVGLKGPDTKPTKPR